MVDSIPGCALTCRVRVRLRLRVRRRM